MSFNLQIGFTEGGPIGHEHQRAVDPGGDGNTDINENHMHIIVQGKVMPAGEDNHTHRDVDYPLKGNPRGF